MKRKKWVNKVIALLLAAIMIVPSSLGTVAYAQEPEVSSEQTQTIQNADEDISEANEQETADASQKEQEKKETQETQDTESKETQKEDSYEVKLSKADNGLLSFPISEDDLVKADVENSTQSILDASEEDILQEFIKITRLPQYTYVTHIKCGRYDYQWYDSCNGAFGVGIF